ncbi:hypothetical protein GIB67_028086, partial [Kingdonia uniflora]
MIERISVRKRALNQMASSGKEIALLLEIIHPVVVLGARSYASSVNRLHVRSKRGIPWSKKEHRTFLEGLGRLGKGDWKGISKIFVLTRTPTQIASHVQKFFLRQATLNKKKRRSSLFDLAARTQISNVPVKQTNDVLPKELDVGLCRSIMTPFRRRPSSISGHRLASATSVVASHGIPSFQRVPYMIKLSFLDLFLNFRVKDKCFVHLLPLDKLYSEPSDKCDCIGMGQTNSQVLSAALA